MDDLFRETREVDVSERLRREKREVRSTYIPVEHVSREKLAEIESVGLLQELDESMEEERISSTGEETRKRADDLTFVSDVWVAGSPNETSMTPGM